MKRSVLFLAASAVILCLGGIPAFAQRGGGGGRGGGGMGGMGGGMGNQRDPMGTRNQKQPKNPKNDNNVAAELKKNTALAKRLEALLPESADAQMAARGFSSVGDLMATAHASKNLNIPFSNLRRQVIGARKVSLDKAIQNLQSDTAADAAKTAAKTAKQQGNEDIKAAKAEMKAAKDAEKKSSVKS